MINFLFDALEAIPEKNTVYALIKSNCSLKYDLNTLKNNMPYFSFFSHKFFDLNLKNSWVNINLKYSKNMGIIHQSGDYFYENMVLYY